MMSTPEEYQEMLSSGCPWCGEPLAIKHGKYGEFIACSEWCGYTKDMPGTVHKWPPDVAPKVCSLKKCDGSGLIPLRRKSDNSIVPFAWVFCECREEEHEYDRRVRPSDFDFSMSYDFYRSLCYQHGWPDPGSDIPQEEEVKPEVIVKHITVYDHVQKNEGKDVYE